MFDLESSESEELKSDESVFGEEDVGDNRAKTDQAQVPQWRATVVGVSGGTRSGKSTLARLLKQALPEAKHFDQDHYFLAAVDGNAEHPDTIDHKSLQRDVAAAAKEAVFVIVDGFLCFHDEELASLIDMKIHLDISVEESRRRRTMLRDDGSPLPYNDHPVTPEYFDKHIAPYFLSETGYVRAKVDPSPDIARFHVEDLSWMMRGRRSGGRPPRCPPNGQDVIRLVQMEVQKLLAPDAAEVTDALGRAVRIKVGRWSTVREAKARALAAAERPWHISTMVLSKPGDCGAALSDEELLGELRQFEALGNHFGPPVLVPVEVVVDGSKGEAPLKLTVPDTIRVREFKRKVALAAGSPVAKWKDVELRPCAGKTRGMGPAIDTIE